MAITRRAAITAGVLAAAFGGAVPRAQAGCLPDSDSVITNGSSGLFVIENAPDDFSLKIVSGDGTKNVTFVRYKGTTAEADVQRIYASLKATMELMGLSA